MANKFLSFKRRLARKNFRVAVIGLGYVGLPLAVEFARKGIEVVGIEIDADRLKHIAGKRSYISDISTKELRRVSGGGKFGATADFAALSSVDVVIICVPTPLKGKYLPDITYIEQAVTSIARNLRRGSLVILESTTYPGTTEEVILPLLKNHGLVHGRDFYLSFSPERIDPGNRLYPVRKIPKVVGGLSREATELTELVYRNIIDEVIPVSSARTAEAVKLLENTFRLINIAAIDELSMMAHKMGIDIWEVIRAASTKPFGFMPFYPGPGVGGHCIPKDPLYLYWKAKHFGFRSRFIKLASDIINFMPEYVVERVAEELKSIRKPLAKAKVLVVGVTYKKDIKDLRKSPSIDIITILMKNGAKASYHDPLIPFLKISHINLKSVELTRAALRRFDCVVIAADHSCLDYGLILKSSNLIFDTRNVYKGNRERKVVRL